MRVISSASASRRPLSLIQRRPRNAAVSKERLKGLLSMRAELITRQPLSLCRAFHATEHLGPEIDLLAHEVVEIAGRALGRRHDGIPEIGEALHDDWVVHRRR